MTKEALEKRIAELRKFVEQILGAISECEYWLKQLETEKATEQ